MLPEIVAAFDMVTVVPTTFVIVVFAGIPDPKINMPILDEEIPEAPVIDVVPFRVPLRPISELK